MIKKITFLFGLFLSVSALAQTDSSSTEPRGWIEFFYGPAHTYRSLGSNQVTFTYFENGSPKKSFVYAGSSDEATWTSESGLLLNGILDDRLIFTTGLYFGRFEYDSKPVSAAIITNLDTAASTVTETKPDFRISYRYYSIPVMLKYSFIKKTKFSFDGGLGFEYVTFHYRQLQHRSDGADYKIEMQDDQHPRKIFAAADLDVNFRPGGRLSIGAGIHFKHQVNFFVMGNPFNPGNEAYDNSLFFHSGAARISIGYIIF